MSEGKSFRSGSAMGADDLINLLLGDQGVCGEMNGPQFVEPALLNGHGIWDGDGVGCDHRIAWTIDLDFHRGIAFVGVERLEGMFQVLFGILGIEWRSNFFFATDFIPGCIAGEIPSS